MCLLESVESIDFEIGKAAGVVPPLFAAFARTLSFI